MKQISYILSFIFFMAVIFTSSMAIAKNSRVLTANMGHSESAYAIEYSPDGKYLVTGGGDGTLILWHAQSKKELRSFKGHEKFICDIAFGSAKQNSFGDFFISASDDTTLKKWNPLTGEMLQTYRGHKYRVTSVAISPDYKYMASGSIDKTIRIWDIKTGQTTKILTGHNGSVGKVIYSKNGKFLVSGSGDHTIKLWDINSGDCVYTFNKHKKHIVDIDVYWESGLMLSVDADKKMFLWDLSKPKVIKRLNGVNNDVESASFSKDGRYVIATFIDGKTKIWHVKTGYLIKTMAGHTDSAEAHASSPDMSTIVTASIDGTIRIWDPYSGKESDRLGDTQDPAFYAGYTPGGKYFFVKTGYGCVKLWNIENTRETKIFEKGGLFSFSPDGRYLVTDAGRGKINKWDINNGKLLNSFNAELNILTSLTYETSGNSIVVSGFTPGNYIKRIDSFSGKILEKSSGRSQIQPKDMTFTSGNDHMIFEGSNWEINVRGYKNEHILTPPDAGVKLTSFAVSPDGKLVAGAYTNGVINVWEISSGSIKLTFKGHQESATDLTFSHDSQNILSGNTNQLILWNAETGKIVQTYKKEVKEQVYDLSFSPDSKFIIECGGTSVRIWDKQKALQLCTIISSRNSTDYVAYTPDGRFDGSKELMGEVYFVEGMQIIPLSSMFEQYYTPDLLGRIFAGERFDEPKLKIDFIKMPPLVQISTPNQSKYSSDKSVSLNVAIQDNGGGIGEIRLYQNEKLIKSVIPQSEAKEIKKEFSASLVNGINRFKAVAFSKQRTESLPSQVSINYYGKNIVPDLHVLVIGINNYKNPNYALNYALADANAFKDELLKSSKSLFNNINLTFLKDSDFTKVNLMKSFLKLQKTVSQEDVFVFYYAGHGIMGMENNPQFYIIPYNITQLYENKQQLEKLAVSTKELQTFSKNLKAQKQLFIFDACHSGGITKTLVTRGAAEDKALAQLARSTGTYWMAASGSEQFAAEFSKLGHGIFTYCILEGIKGKANSSKDDSKITIRELSSYVENKVPELSAGLKGAPQYPRIFGYGMDFPLVILK